MKITLEFDTYQEMCEYASFLVGKEPPFDSETLKKAEATPEKKTEATPEKKTEAAPEKKAEPALEKKAEPAPEKKAEPAPEKKAEPALEKTVSPSEIRVFAAEYIRGAKDAADRDTRRHNLKALLDEFQVRNVTMLCDDKPSFVPEFFRRLKEVAAHAE